MSAILGLYLPANLRLNYNMTAVEKQKTADFLDLAADFLGSG
jgi:hypothetical protein